jgi:hypothetical protein
VTINIAAGTYAPFVCGTLNGSGVCSVIGDITTPSNVVVHATAGEAVNVANANNYTIAGMRVVSDANGTASLGCGLRLESAVVAIYNMDFGPCFYAQIFADSGSRLNILGTSEGDPSYFINVDGNSQAFVYALSGSVVDLGKTILNQSGAITYSVAFIEAGQSASIQASFSAINLAGSVSGPRYLAYGNGVINTYGSGGSYFPGNAAGTTATGGQYL